jgi:hypothetical protein
MEQRVGCSEGQVLEDGECVSEGPVCPEGQQRNDERECVAIRVAEGGIAPPYSGDLPVFPEVAPSISPIITAIAAVGGGIALYRKLTNRNDSGFGIEVVTHGGIE